MSRQQLGLRAPRPGDVSHVPSTSRHRPLHRACASHRKHPWWFSSRDTTADPGRFDLQAGSGTCYWALSPAAAIIEKTSDPDQIDSPVLTLHALGRLRVWTAADVPAARSRLADTTVASVPGLTDEIGTVVPYHLPWAWADAFEADDRHGVVYRARFAKEESVALFGTAGAQPDEPAAVPASAITHFNDLPAGFREGVGTVGDFDSLPRGPAP